MSPPAQPRRLGLETLESRDTPSTLFSDTFEQNRVPNLSPGWSSWGTDTYITTKISAATGQNAVSSLGSPTTYSRLWNTLPQPGDAPVSVKILTDTPTPVELIARGENLSLHTGTYVAARITTGARQIDLVELRGETTTTLATLRVPTNVYSTWLNVTLKPVGNLLSLSVQRGDTGQFLTAQGTWQTAATNALHATTTLQPATGFAGIGRTPGGAGMAFFDDFLVESPPAQLIQENFDTTAISKLPTTWTGWTSDSTPGFVASVNRANSAPNGLIATGGTNTTARAWLTATQPAAVQATASLYADTLVPGTLFVRGDAVNTPRATYYGVTVTRGLDVRLVQVVNGVETTLATVKSKGYVSGVWLRVTLTADGDKLRAIVSRTDSGQWLNADGDWLNSPEPAIDVTDTAIRTGGYVGVILNARTAGPVAFDDFEVRPASNTAGPQVTLAASQTGTSYTGDVTFKVTAAASQTARRIEFRLDGKLRSAAQSTPAEWTLDTTLLANGSHELIVRAVDETGNVSTTSLPFTSNNANAAPLPPRPEIPRKYTHIRIAQLAYSGNPLGDFEKARLKDSVDLVVPNPQYLSAIDAASPTTPQIIYSNLSNLYQGLLTDWLNYADRTNAAREAAFYHVSQATAFTGSSPSSQPVNYFWDVSRSNITGTGTPTDYTSAARGGRSFSTEFGAVGTAVSISYLEKFREVNLDLSRVTNAGWQGTFEYVTATTADGTPLAWKALTLSQDSTNALKQAGQVTFDPPADWIPSKTATGTDRLYTIRIRTTAGTQADAPVAKTIFGRDYVLANGQAKGTIPAFDAAADKNGDGYLNDAEYANRAKGKDARFVYESRLFYPYYGQMRFVTNPSSSAVRKWAADYHTRILQQNPLADGFFLDNSNGRFPSVGSPIIELITNYSEDSANLVASVWKAIAPKMVFTNTSGGSADANAVTQSSTGVFEEFVLRPTDANWAAFNDVASLVKQRLGADSPSPYVILDSHPGSFATTDDRVRTGTLAYYYLLADPNRTMLMFFGGYAPSAPWSQIWIPAASVNVGQPNGAFTTFASGKDPENTTLDYRVYSRQYADALVLYKPRSYTLGVGTGTISDATATTHTLDGNYRVLNADGTRGTVINQITIRNGEGVVLMKA